MTTSNLARTIGITVVGYSSADPSPEEILAATQVRYNSCDWHKFQLFSCKLILVSNLYHGEAHTDWFGLLEHLLVWITWGGFIQVSDQLLLFHTVYKSDIYWPIRALCKSKRTYKKIIEANFVFSVTIEFCLQTHPRQSSRKWTTQLQWGCRCETVKYMKLNPCPRLQQEKYFHHQFCCRKWVILIYNWASSSTYFSCFIYKYIYIAYYILTAV